MFVAPISAIRGAPEHLLPAVDRCFEELVSHLESFGGLDTIYRFNIGEGRAEFVDEPLSNREHLREGIAIALSPYLGPREQCR